MNSIDSRVLNVLQSAQNRFKDLLGPFSETGLSLDQYKRFLTMQFHLTKGVQRPFFLMAASSTFTHRPKMREFLVEFGMVEELHFKIAEKDLENLGSKPGPMPEAVAQWWSTFEPFLFDQPLVRLGATVILENITKGSSELLDHVLSRSSFLNQKNTKFLQIHRHEELPHGDQILDALDQAKLSHDEWAEVAQGAKMASDFYESFLTWVLQNKAAKAA
jgi:hypothetical protein